MSFLKSDKNQRSKPLSKNMYTTSAASVLSVFMLMAVAPTAAQAQVIDITLCAELGGPNHNPGVADAGATVNIDLNSVCNIASGDAIELEDGDQDDIVINILSGTTIVAQDQDDEDVVIFIDNSENNTTINVAAGAALRGANGVIFIEGDGTQITNYGNIVGTGTAEEGVIYVDRDTDSDLINIFNGSTGQIRADDNGPAIGIEVLIADGADDAGDIGNQDAFTDFPDIRIFNEAGGLIETTGTVSDDNDAINIAGAPGDTGGFTRACIEGTAINCVANIRITNEGTIRSIFDNSGSAGITFEDDAVFRGGIVNRRDGVITGTRNGIRVGDVAVDDGTGTILTAEHMGRAGSGHARIQNLGVISGTGASSRGIDLEGDNVRITNREFGTISGASVGIEVGAGSSSGVNHSGLNNFIENAGVISGSNYSIDSTNAEGALRILSEGGTFTGNIRGSLGNTDTFVIGAGNTVLTHDVLQDYEVRVAQTGTLTFDGDRRIEGSLESRGTLSMDVANTQTVTGDVYLRPNSIVEITDAGNVSSIGDQFTLISVGGTLTNGSKIDNTLLDNSLLLEFEYVASNDLVVEAVAAGTGSNNAKVSGYLSAINFDNGSSTAFGGSVLGAFVDGSLDNTMTFSNLAGISTAEDLGQSLNSLAPDFDGTLVQNVFNSIQSGAANIDHRLSDLNCNALGGSESCATFAKAGAWIQSSRPHSSQGSLSLSAPTYFNNGSDQDSITMTYGYDHAIDNSTLVGFSGTYTETEIDEDAYAVSSSDIDVVQFAAYAGHRVGNVHLVTKASYSHAEAETSRQSFDVIKSQVDIDGLNIQGVASYNVDMGKGVYLKPEAGLHYNNITTGSYTEAGGLNLNIDEANSNVLDGRVGLTLGARKVVSDTTRADVYVTGAVRNDFYGQRDDLGYNFAGQTGSLAVLNNDKFAVQALAGVNLLSGKNFSFGGAVNSEFSESENSVGGSLQTKVRW